MAEDYRAACLRHFFDAEVLALRERWGGAGHLIGFAAECALKYRIENLRPDQNAPHGHFPQLIEAAKKQVASRRDTAMHQVLKISGLMAGWDVSLRYADDGAVLERHYENWRDHATRLLNAAGIRRARVT